MAEINSLTVKELERRVFRFLECGLYYSHDLMAGNRVLVNDAYHICAGENVYPGDLEARERLEDLVPLSRFKEMLREAGYKLCARDGSNGDTRVVYPREQ